MGIDIHAFNFLKYVGRRHGLGRVATIGRQALIVTALRARYPSYCEDFLIHELGATLVHSYDYSAYEGATHVVDLNLPIAVDQQYETVIDCGTLEHVYNAPQALQNLSKLCARGGQIVHVLPANNFCGHGFWQFSPELFFSLYSEKNGYAGTQVFVAALSKSKVWYQVLQNRAGRTEVTSRSPVYVMCTTVKRSDCPHNNIQQSDYIPLWNAGTQLIGGQSCAGLRALIKSRPRLYSWLLTVRDSISQRLQRIKTPTSLSGRNPYLKKVSVADLLTQRAEG